MLAQHVDEHAAVVWHGQGRETSPELCFSTCMQDGTGKISLRMLQSYASKHGGETLTLEDLKGGSSLTVFESSSC